MRELSENIPFIFLGQPIGQEAVIRLPSGCRRFIRRTVQGGWNRRWRAVRLASANQEFERNANTIKDVQKRFSMLLTARAMDCGTGNTVVSLVLVQGGRAVGYDAYEFSGSYEDFLNRGSHGSLGLQAMDAHAFLNQPLDMECRFVLGI